jgi:NADPH:quinone reductase-like Zn-dependent oxidoreductase
MMKALVRHEFGGPAVVHVEEVDQPALTDDRVLVRVRASSLNKADWHQLRGWPRFLRPFTRGGVLRPKSPLLGSDFAGVVEAVGKDRTDLAPGDEVFGARSGAFAEYVNALYVVRKPPNVTFEEAGTMGIAGLTALQGLRDHGRLQPGQRVLINGASGGVGTLAVQIAKALGAHVTAVCSTRNIEQTRALGADRVLESGALKPAIDRTYELDEAQDALRTFGEGHVRGKLVLTM